ncbi:MAG: BrnT family toxin [Acidobacteriota bacterium]
MLFSMAEKFSWDPQKDTVNRLKHRVSFEEATTIFLDPLSLTKPDTSHSWLEHRFVTLGLTRITHRLLVVAHQDHQNLIRIISARVATRRERKQYETGGWIAEMKSEYDFSDGVRGKYANRFSADCVMIQLAPDVAEVFPDAEAVNAALRELIPETGSQRESRPRDAPE